MKYIYGIGNQAKELYNFLNFKGLKKISFTYESQKDKDLKIIDTRKIKYSSNIYMGVGSPYYKFEIYNKFEKNNWTTIVNKEANVKNSIGKGSIIFNGTTITSNVSIGIMTMINIGCNISHDVSIGNFCTISPGVNIAGNCLIDDGVFIGIGVNIINGIKVAKGVVIGAGSTVITDLSVENGVYAGSPAKLIKKNKTWLKKI